MAVTTNQNEGQEVDALAADLEGKLTTKGVMAWKEAIASFVRSSIFPRKQFVTDEEICWGSVIQKVICTKTLGRFPGKWQEFWEEQGGMEVVRRTVARRRQSSADGQKKNFQSKYQVRMSMNKNIGNLINCLAANVEWVEAATRNRSNVTEQIIEPPKPDELEKEMRKDTNKYIQFVVRMLPPVYGKEMWNGIVVKTNLSEFVTPSQEAFALLLYKNGYEAWSWMTSDSSSSDGSGNGSTERPIFKYTARSKEHVMARNSGWTTEGLDMFNVLYELVKKDREANGRVFDEALLEYYKEKSSKKRKPVTQDEAGSRGRVKISDDLDGFVAETLGSVPLELDGEVIQEVREI